jgi:hypothetical protein
MRKNAIEEENQREKDMKVIERCRFEGLPIPSSLKQKYGDDLTECNHNFPNQNATDAKPLTKAQRIRHNLLR